MEEKLKNAVTALVTAQTAQAEANVKLVEAATILLNLATIVEKDKGAAAPAEEPETEDAPKKEPAKDLAEKPAKKAEKEEPAEEPGTPDKTDGDEDNPITLVDLQALVMKVMKEHDKEIGKGLIAQFTSDGSPSLKMVTKDNFEALKEAAEDLL